MFGHPITLPSPADEGDRAPSFDIVDPSWWLPVSPTADAHPLYHRLIRAFEEETGVPMVLNTSFNENEPIVHRPEEAVDCFLRTDMDVLALGPRVVRKRKATLSPSRDQTCGTSSAT